MTESLLQQLDFAQQQIEQIKQRMQQVCAQSPDVELLIWALRSGVEKANKKIGNKDVAA